MLIIRCTCKVCNINCSPQWEGINEKKCLLKEGVIEPTALLVQRARIEKFIELVSSMDKRVLRWFGHVERVDKERMGRRVLMAEISGVQVQGRLWLGRVDGVKVTMSSREMTV